MKKITLFALAFCLTGSLLAQPANDEPCGAINLPVTTYLNASSCTPTDTYTWTAATVSVATGFVNNCFSSNPSGDVWFKITVPANGQLEIKTAYGGSGIVDLAMQLYYASACNGTFTYIDCNDDDNNSVLPYLNKSGLTPASIVYLRLRPYSGGIFDGSVKICVSSNSTPGADEPCNAPEFIVGAADPLGQACVAQTNLNWQNATLTPAIPNPTCLSNTPPSNIRDVWFKFTAPASGKLTLTASSINNTALIALYSASACNGSFTEITCHNFSNSFSTNWNLNPGTVYYSRVFIHNYSSTLVYNNGSISFCLIDRKDVPAINNSVKVGIGIDSPFAKLDVVGTGIIRDNLLAGKDVEVRGDLIVQGNIRSKYGSSAVTGSLRFDSISMPNVLGNKIALYGGLGNTNKFGLGIQSSLLQMYTGAMGEDIAFGYGNSYNFKENIRFKGNGNVGIGIADPSNYNHGGTNRILQIHNDGIAANSQSQLMLSSGTTAIGSIGALNFVGTNLSFADRRLASISGILNVSSADLSFFTNNNGVLTEKMRIAGNGNVGIGTTTPVVPLQFSNNSFGTKISLYQGAFGHVGMGVYSGELRLQNDFPNGKVSMGVLETTGAYTELAKAERNGAFAFSVLGSLWVNGTTYASDERFKQNITAIQLPLQKLLQLNGVEYEMRVSEFAKNHFQTGRQMGLIAQNVEKVVPDAVQEKDGYKGVDYAKLVPLLIESIKAQQQQIEALKQEVADLKRRN
jgi:hypothetical protein